MEISKVLQRMIAVARKALLLHRAFAEHGYSATPHFDLYAETADAICILIGDAADDFTETETFLVLNNDSLTDDQRIEKLMCVFKRCAA